MAKRIASGANYVSQGLRLIREPGLRRYVVVPMIINILLLSAAIFVALNQTSHFIEWVKTSWGWSGPVLDIILWPIVIVTLLLAVCYLFAIVANWIAAPFNGLLSEAVEHHLTGASNPAPWYQGFKDLPRMLGRELSKLIYYIPRAILFLLAFFFLPVIGQILWFLFSAWMMSIQYVDYPMDNHRIPFSEATRALKQRRSEVFGFGSVVMFITMIPVVNIFIMPVAVAGGTALWVDHYRENYRNY